MPLQQQRYGRINTLIFDERDMLANKMVAKWGAQICKTSEESGKQMLCSATEFNSNYSTLFNMILIRRNPASSLPG